MKRKSRRWTLAAMLAATTCAVPASAESVLTASFSTFTTGDAGGQVIQPAVGTQLGATTVIYCPANAPSCVLELRARVSVDYGPGGDNRIYVCGEVDGQVMDDKCSWPIDQPSGAQQTFGVDVIKTALAPGKHTMLGYVYTSKGLHAHYYSYFWQMYVVH